MELLWDRARTQRRARRRAASSPTWARCATAPPVGLRRLAGPPLRRTGDAAATPAAAAPQPPAPRTTRGGRAAPGLRHRRRPLRRQRAGMGARPAPEPSRRRWTRRGSPSSPAELPAIHERAIAGQDRARPLGDGALLAHVRPRRRRARRRQARPLGRLRARAHAANVAALAKLFPEARLHPRRARRGRRRALPRRPAARLGRGHRRHADPRAPARARDRARGGATAGPTRRSRASRPSGRSARSRVLRATYDDLLERPRGRRAPLPGVRRRALRRALPAPAARDPRRRPRRRRRRRAAKGDTPRHDAVARGRPRAERRAARPHARYAASAPGSRTRMSPVDVERLSEKARRAPTTSSARLVPEGATVLIASRGDEEILQHPGPRPAGTSPSGGGSSARSTGRQRGDRSPSWRGCASAGARYLFFPVHRAVVARALPGAARATSSASTGSSPTRTARGVLFELPAWRRRRSAPAPAAAGRPPARRDGAATAGRRPPCRATGPRIVMVTDHFPKFSETFFVSKFLGLRARGWDVHVVCNRSNEDQWQYFPGLREDPDLLSRLHPTKDFERDDRRAEAGARALRLRHARARAHARRQAGRRAHRRELPRLRRQLPRPRGPGLLRRGLAAAPTCCTSSARTPGSARSAAAARRTSAARGHHRRGRRLALRPAAARGGASRATPERPLRILSVGRLHWKKGHEFGLARDPRAGRRGRRGRATAIIGDGPHREATLFAIHDLGLADHVELLGRPARRRRSASSSPGPTSSCTRRSPRASACRRSRRRRWACRSSAATPTG